MEIEKSATCTVFPIVSALDKADDMIGKGRKWNSVNYDQGTFLPIFDTLREQARGLKEIQSMASRSAEEINNFLASKGFQIKLDPFEEPTDFGTASVLDVLVEWLVEGHITQITSARDGKSVFPAVSLVAGVSFARAAIHKNPIVVIETKSGDRLCMTVGGRLESFDLLNKINALSLGMAPVYDYNGVVFPQVDLDREVDISWLKQLWTTAEDHHDYEVTQALQQTKFRMNEKGARAQSAVAIGISRCTSIQPVRPPVVIDEPFLVWIERPGLKQPLFTGWISEENWKTPKDLSIQ